MAPLGDGSSSLKKEESETLRRNKGHTGIERRMETAKRATVSGVGSEGKGSGSIRGHKVPSSLTFVAATIALLSLTSNIVVFYKS